MRATDHLSFQERFDKIVQSDGKECFPNVKWVADPQNALDELRRTTIQLPFVSPYRFKVRDLPPADAPVKYHVVWYPKIFRNGAGMAGQFDGSGAILTSGSGTTHHAAVYTFAFCEHNWDTSGANHLRGWHPQVCRKCGFDASIDSGD